MARPYFSVRTGRNRGDLKLDFELLRDAFIGEIEAYEERGLLQEHFGKYCPDADEGLEPGTLGRDPGLTMMRRLRKRINFPFRPGFASWTEDDLFDVIEFMYDHISRPVEGKGHYHNYSGCGWHYDTFEAAPAQAEFRDTMNELLRDYGPGYEMSSAGEILQLLPTGLNELTQLTPPGADQTVRGRLDSAVTAFRRRGSTFQDRRIAVRELADILEHLRPTALTLLNKKDEADLFNLANNFGIRHANATQKTDYDETVWLSWMFHFYLATIHASLNLMVRKPAVNVSGAGKALAELRWAKPPN